MNKPETMSSWGIFISRIIFTGIVFCALFSNSFCQDLPTEQVEKRALKNFENEDYYKAINDFEVLQKLYPKDPRIAYYLGRTYLGSNKNLSEAAELLRFASIRNYGNDGYFYLGRTYHLIQDYTQAAEAFRTFKEYGANRDVKSYDIDYWITVNKNAEAFSEFQIPINITKFQDVYFNGHELAFADKIDGKYIYVPAELKSEADLALDYESLIFVPSDIKIGDFLYFQSYSSRSKDGLDIYRIERISEDEYSVPERLPSTINTSYNDAYPFYDKKTNTLFFSSKGHNTAGGYDIFRCEFNPKTRDWSEVENLCAPINSTFDDFLYTVSLQRDNAFFLSQRNTNSRNFAAYKLNYKLHAEYIKSAKKFNLTGISNVGSLENEEVTTTTVTINKTSKNQDNGKEKELKDYEKLLNEALELQLQSDSLTIAVKQLQKQLETEKDYQKKQNMVAQITMLSKESKRMLMMADEKYMLGEEMRTKENQKNTEAEKKPVVVTEKRPDITVYTHQSDQKETEIVEKPKETEKVVKPVTTPKQEESDFRILTSSPYSASNPIPNMSDNPNTLTYRVQVGVYARKVAENAFGGMSPMVLEKIIEKNLIKYYVGSFSSISQANKALEKVKEYGYSDAFIVAYYNQQRISLQKAREIEFTKN